MIRINGADLFVAETGEDRLGTIITLHGGRGVGTHAGDFRAWSPMAEKGYRIISYDMRGHGQSSGEGPLTYAQLAADLEALREALVGKPAIILGGSFGGYIALTYAVTYPHGLTHLVLRGTAPSWHHELSAIENARKASERWPLISPAAVERMFAGDIENETEMRLRSFANSPMAMGRNFDADAALRSALSTTIRIDTARALFRVGHDYDLRDRLHEIAAPTFIVTGSEDWTCTPDNARLMAERIPDSELLIVEGAPHGVHTDSPDLVLSRTAAFLAKPRP